MSKEIYDESDLREFATLQHLAYEAAESVGAGLREGMTERDAVKMMEQWLAGRGVNQYFHAPFAWFGDRTAFTGFRLPTQFFPSGRKLQEGMPVILDIAPIRDGYSADIGYSMAFGENRALDRMKDDLEVFRGRILEFVMEERTMSEIYIEVDRLIAKMGYHNCHYKYPFHTLGHKVGRMPLRWAPSIRVGRFDLRSLHYLNMQFLKSVLPGGDGRNPIMNSERSADVRAEPGLWAIEPHIGRDGVGAKWEEILVVTDSRAYWLDDDLPHVRGWQQHGGASAAALH